MGGAGRIVAGAMEQPAEEAGGRVCGGGVRADIVVWATVVKASSARHVWDRMGGAYTPKGRWPRFGRSQR